MADDPSGWTSTRSTRTSTATPAPVSARVTRPAGPRPWPSSCSNSSAPTGRAWPAECRRHPGVTPNRWRCGRASRPERRATASPHKLPRCGSLSRNPLLSLSQIGRSGAGPVSESISADSFSGERFWKVLTSMGHVGPSASRRRPTAGPRLRGSRRGEARWERGKRHSAEHRDVPAPRTLEFTVGHSGSGIHQDVLFVALDNSQHVSCDTC